jgi:hypothetical protein
VQRRRKERLLGGRTGGKKDGRYGEGGTCESPNSHPELLPLSWTDVWKKSSEESIRSVSEKQRIFADLYTRRFLLR